MELDQGGTIQVNKQRIILQVIIVLSFSLLFSTAVFANEAKIVAFKAIDFIAQGGGEVRFPSDRQYPTFSHWDYSGHWLEWEVDIPEDGVYLTFAMYATGNHLVERQLFVDDQPLADLVFWTTSDFRTYKLGYFDPVTLTAGKHRVRLLVSGNEGEHSGINLAWFAFATPEIFALEDHEIVAVIDKMLGF